MSHFLASLLASEELCNCLHKFFWFVWKRDAVFLRLVKLIDIPLLLALLNVLDDLIARHIIVANVAHNAAHFLIFRYFKL